MTYHQRGKINKNLLEQPRACRAFVACEEEQGRLAGEPSNTEKPPMKRKQLFKRAFADAHSKMNPSFTNIRINWKRPRRLGASLPLILGLALLVNSSARAQLASDLVHGYAVNGSAQYTPSGTGHTGKAGDYAIDLGMGGSTVLAVSDPGFFSAVNAAASNDTLTVSFWANLYQISAASGFFFVSPSSNNGERGDQAHLPWSDDNIYYDTDGCCNAGQQRISAAISTFPGYSGDDTWWNQWHHFVFVKNKTDKQIWIDGLLFLDGGGASPLPTDFNLLDIGSGLSTGVANSIQGQIDDFAVFGSGLSSNDIVSIFTGTSPTALTSDNLLAFWNFNPTKPLTEFLSAGPGSLNATPDIAANIELANTATQVQTNSIQLAINGTSVLSSAVVASNATINAIEGSTNGAITIQYISPVLFPAGSTQSVTLVYSDNATPANVYSNTYSIVIEPYNGYTADSVKGYNGFLEGSAYFTADAGGHTGKAGDRAIDLDLVGAAGDIHVTSAGFLNQGSASNTLSFSVWAKLHHVAAGDLIYAGSPSSGGAGFEALLWSDDNIYFDTAGCCDTSAQRISGPISGLAAYTDDSFWTNWHHYVFLYNKTDKQIWIDGALFLDSSSTDPLPVDFNSLFFGSSGSANNYEQAVVDDVAVFATAISSNSISMLTNGAAPSSLAGETLLAYWNFNTPSTGEPLVSGASTPAPGSTGIWPTVGADLLILNRGNLVQTNSIKLALNGADVTSAASIKSTAAGAEVTFTSPALLAALSTNTLTLVFSDNATPADVQTNTRTFVVQPYTYYSRDSVKNYLGIFQGSTTFTPDAGGRTGKAGDRAIDLHMDGTGGVDVAGLDSLSALNAAAGNDMLSVSFWMKLYSIQNCSAVWMNSPSAGRDWNEHVPWSDDNIYFDTGGCCDGAAQRISQNISMLPTYVDDGFWTNWHQYVFFKNLSDKQIWIDGVQFMDGSSTDPLTTDINELFIATAGNDSIYGLMDDFAIFGDPLSTANIAALAAGTSPSALGDTNLVMYWAFNDVGPAFLASRIPAPNASGVAFTGPTSKITVTTIDGSTSVKTNTISLTFNGVNVTAQAAISAAGGVTSIGYAPAPLPSGSSNTVTLVFSDSGTPANVTSNTWSYTTELYSGSSKDTLHGYLGWFQPTGGFTTNGGGHTGQPGDYAYDSSVKGGPFHIEDATFLYPAETNDTLSFSFWIKKYDIAAASAVWVDSPSSSGGERGFSITVPWSDDTLYYDTSGCCDANAQRISAPISNLGAYTDDSFWTNNWHHFAVLYNKGDKQIWIDGVQFLDGSSTNALALDFTDMWLGRDVGDNDNMHGLMDDFAAFSTSLSTSNIVLLSKGTLPTALTGETLLAYWNFNDASAVGPVLKLTGIQAAGGNLTISWTGAGTLQESTLLGPNAVWSDLAGVTNSPATVPIGGNKTLFFRVRQ